MAEQRTFNPLVQGSTPWRPTDRACALCVQPNARKRSRKSRAIACTIRWLSRGSARRRLATSAPPSVPVVRGCGLAQYAALPGWEANRHDGGGTGGKVVMGLLGKGDVLTGAVHTASAAREGIEAAVKVAEPGNFASVWTMSRDAATDWAKLGVLDDKVPGVIRIMVPKPSGEPSWRRTASSSGAEWRWATRGTPGPSPTGTRVTRRRLTRPSASSVTPVQGQVRQAAMPIQARLVRVCHVFRFGATESQDPGPVRPHVGSSSQADPGVRSNIRSRTKFRPSRVAHFVRR